VPSLRLR